jgi:outer membrane protein assembly factor BamB
MRRVRVGVCWMAVLMVLWPVLGLATTAAAGGTPLGLDPAFGPPGTTTELFGGTFHPRTAVDVYLDSKVVAVAASDAFGNIDVPVRIPTSAIPGPHVVAAIERNGDAAIQVVFTVRTDWPQFHDTARHKGLDATENVLGPGNVGRLDEDWRFRTQLPVASSPIVAQGMVFVNAGRLYALNRSTGKPLWSQPTGDSFQPAYANGTVYVATLVGESDAVSAFDASNGQEIWQFGVTTSPGDVTVAGGLVLSPNADQRVYALNAGDGSLAWKSAVLPAQPHMVTVGGDRAYVAACCGTASKVVALDMATGETVWSSIRMEGTVAPLFTRGLVIGIHQDRVLALNAATGHVVWNVDRSGGQIRTTPAVANGVLYLGVYAEGGTLIAMGLSDARHIWGRNLLTDPNVGVSSSPALANGVLYVGTDDGQFLAVEASSGDILWSARLGGAVDSSPAVADGVVYVGSNDRTIRAYDLAAEAAGPH